MTSTPQEPAVTLVRWGPYLVVRNPPPEVVGRLAVGRVEPAGPTGTGVAVPKRPLFATRPAPRGRTEAVVPAGLEAVLVGLLNAAGVPFTVTDGVTPPPFPHPVAVEAVTDPGVIAFVAKNPHGLVRYGDGVGLLWLIVQVCLAFPTAKVVVIVRRKSEAAALACLLSRHGITPTTTAGGVVIEHQRRVTVTLLGQMGLVEFGKADLVLVADALHATRDDPLTARPEPALTGWGGRRHPKATGLLERLADATSARVFGFLPRHRPRSPDDTARCWQAYGPGELLVARHGVVEAGVAVRLLPANIGNNAKYKVAVAQNRVRMGPVRVRRLARVARALRAGDPVQIERAFPGLPHGVGGVTPRNVVLLVDTLKQAGAFRKHLLDWPIVSGLGMQSAGSDGDGGMPPVMSNKVTPVIFKKVMAATGTLPAVTTSVPPVTNACVAPTVNGECKSSGIPNSDNCKNSGISNCAISGRSPVSSGGKELTNGGHTGAFGVIATALGVGTLPAGAFDVVVRADPGDGLPPLPPSWREATDPSPRARLLVDARDGGHHLAALWSRKRRRAYRAAGFTFLGEDPDVTASERFRVLVEERGERP